jgi:hypothetical protein
MQSASRFADPYFETGGRRARTLRLDFQPGLAYHMGVRDEARGSVGEGVADMRIVLGAAGS